MFSPCFGLFGAAAAVHQYYYPWLRRSGVGRCSPSASCRCHRKNSMTAGHATQLALRNPKTPFPAWREFGTP